MMKDSELKKQVERFCELNRQAKALEVELQDIKLVLAAEFDDRQISRWEDEYLEAKLVEQPGRESADVKRLREAGLVEFIKVGSPSRYFTARRK